MLRMLTKWSHPTRLETRIKESNVRASPGVSMPLGEGSPSFAQGGHVCSPLTEILNAGRPPPHSFRPRAGGARGGRLPGDLETEPVR